MERMEIKFRPYYSDMGKGHDDILRCAECKKLVVVSDLYKTGSCPKCGNKRMNEVRTLSVWELIKIKLGILRFDNSDLFLKEFKYGK